MAEPPPAEHSIPAPKNLLYLAYMVFGTMIALGFGAMYALQKFGTAAEAPVVGKQVRWERSSGGTAVQREVWVYSFVSPDGKTVSGAVGAPVSGSVKVVYASWFPRMNALALPDPSWQLYVSLVAAAFAIAGFRALTRIERARIAALRKDEHLSGDR